MPQWKRHVSLHFIYNYIYMTLFEGQFPRFIFTSVGGLKETSMGPEALQNHLQKPRRLPFSHRNQDWLTDLQLELQDLRTENLWVKLNSCAKKWASVASIATKTILAISACYVFHSQPLREQGWVLDTTGISHSDSWMSLNYLCWDITTPFDLKCEGLFSFALEANLRLSFPEHF